MASVRSTEWLVESTAKGTGVLSLAGEVTVRGLAGGVVVLRPGEGTDVAPGAPPRPPAIWGEARRRDCHCPHHALSLAPRHSGRPGSAGRVCSRR